jgi:photosynthetic reaction center H subunit
MNVTLTPGLDVALLTFYAFVLFFIGLVFYLRREDRREGYPKEDELTGRVESWGGPMYSAYAKTFRLPFDRGSVSTPTKGREPIDIAARRTDRFAGAPYAPTGNPLVDGIGPAGWADRAKVPDLDWEGHARIVPLSTTAGEYWVTPKDPTMQSWPVVGADGKVAGTVTDLWIDRADRLIRYIEVGLEGGGRALAPMPMAVVQRGKRRVVVDAINAADFAGSPLPEAAGTITRYEEERIVAYFGGGYLYANRDRQEPFL